MRWRIPFIAVLTLLFVVVSCDQQPVEPQTTEAGLLGKATASHTFEYRWPGRITWMDSEADWDVFLLGYDPADDFTCNDGQNVGGVPFLEHFIVADLKNASPRLVLVGTMIGRQPLYLYTRASFPPDDAPFAVWCDYLKNGWLAAGSWHFQYMDNNLTGDAPGRNSFGQVETGQLVDRDGNRYKYEWKYRCLHEPGVLFDCVTSVDRVVRK